MSKLFSLDTNILLYAIDAKDSAKHEAAVDLLARARASNCCLAFQTLNELCRAVTRKNKLGLAETLTLVEGLADAFPVVGATFEETKSAIALMSRYNLAFFDALLLATVDGAGGTCLISEDLQDGARYGSVKVMDPFKGRNRSALEGLLVPK